MGATFDDHEGVPAATGIFIAVLTASDLIARTTIAGNSLDTALLELWSSLSLVGAVLLFVPFVGVALICGGANRRARTRSAVTVFVAAMAVLAFFYFDGIQASQQALLDERWTAAALSIGLLPFFVGLPLLGLTSIAAAVVARVDRRDSPRVGSSND